MNSMSSKVFSMTINSILLAELFPALNEIVPHEREFG
jgi:hypothetical protein